MRHDAAHYRAAPPPDALPAAPLAALGRLVRRSGLCRASSATLRMAWCSWPQSWKTRKAYRIASNLIISLLTRPRRGTSHTLLDLRPAWASRVAARCPLSSQSLTRSGTRSWSSRCTIMKTQFGCSAHLARKESSAGPVDLVETGHFMRRQTATDLQPRVYCLLCTARRSSAARTWDETTQLKDPRRTSPAYRRPVSSSQTAARSAA